MRPGKLWVWEQKLYGDTRLIIGGRREPQKRGESLLWRADAVGSGSYGKWVLWAVDAVDSGCCGHWILWTVDAVEISLFYITAQDQSCWV